MSFKDLKKNIFLLCCTLIKIIKNIHKQLQQLLLSSLTCSYHPGHHIAKTLRERVLVFPYSDIPRFQLYADGEVEGLPIVRAPSVIVAELSFPTAKVCIAALLAFLLGHLRFRSCCPTCWQVLK